MSTVTAEDTTHRAEQELGPAIVDGVVRWVSSTLVTQGDHNSEGGCLRRLWFERVGGQPRITTAAMTAGVGMHAEIQMYLETGNRGALGPIALSGLHYIDEPGAGLVVEQPIIIGGNGEIRGVYLRAAGIPFAGHVDLYNHRGAYIDAEGDLRRDPPNTLEVKDWKSTSDLVWAKSPEQVAATVQMNGYAMAGFAMWPHLELARLTHVYFQRNGARASKLATSRPPREQIERKWKYTEGVVRTVVDVAREVNPNAVPYNTNACHSYNKDCPHMHLCAEGKASRTFTSLDDMFGPRLAEMLTARMGTNVEEDFNMGFLDDVTGPAPGITPIAPPAGVGAAISLDDLVAEETAARVAAETATPPVTATPEFAAAVALIGASGLGMPPLGGIAAQMFAATGGQAIAPGAEYDGQLKLGKLPRMSDPTQLVSLADEIKRKFPAIATAPKAAPAPAVQRIEAPTAILPPDAPASSPALAANPVPGLDNAKTRELAAATVPSDIPGLAASVATVPAPVAATPVATSAPAAASAPQTPASEPAATKTPGKRGRPPGSKSKATDAAPGTSLNVYGDVFPDGGVEFTMLDGYVRDISDALCAQFAPDAGDVRCASVDTKLGYNKWLPAVEMLVRAKPPAPGHYLADLRGDTLAEVVFNALREACRASGGVHVRGTR